MDIYWIQDKRKCGPATVPDILSKIQAGELTKQTRGWHKGCGSEWLPLEELPALADFLHREEAIIEREINEELAREEEGVTPQAEPAAPATPTPSAIPSRLKGLPPLPHVREAAEADTTPLPPGMEGAMRVYLPSPSARLLARFVDYGLYTAAYYGLMMARGVEYDITLWLNANPLLWLPMAAIEAALLSTWGTTPGKALMGIRMNTFGEAPRLGFFRAFMRSIMVFTLGAGVMLPIMMPVMLALSFWLLRRRGITQWDALCSTLPILKAPAQPARYVLAIIGLYICTVVTGSCLKPWWPGILGDIEKENPEWAQTLRQMMPKGAAATPKPQPQPEAGKTFDTSLPGM